MPGREAGAVRVCRGRGGLRERVEIFVRTGMRPILPRNCLHEKFHSRFNAFHRPHRRVPRYTLAAPAFALPTDLSESTKFPGQRSAELPGRGAGAARVCRGRGGLRDRVEIFVRTGAEGIRLRNSVHEKFHSRFSAFHRPHRRVPRYTLTAPAFAPLANRIVWSFPSAAMAAALTQRGG